MILAAWSLFTLFAIGFAGTVAGPEAAFAVGVVCVLPVLARAKPINTHTDKGDAG